MDIPNFLKLKGEALLYNGKENTEFQFYLPENFFNNISKNPIAQIDGQYVSSIGLCNWAIVDENGKRSKLGTFNFPTMFLCKPYKIEKVKNLKLETSADATDYRILHFKKGDEVVSQVRVPQNMNNVELFFKLAVITGKTPTTIDYDKGWEIFLENMRLQGSSYGLNAQLFGIIWSELCRDAKNVSKPFRYTDMKDMNGYKPVSIKMLPNYVSPWQAISSEGWDEGVMSAILMKDKEDIPYSPIEKITTM